MFVIQSENYETRTRTLPFALDVFEDLCLNKKEVTLSDETTGEVLASMLVKTDDFGGVSYSVWASRETIKVFQKYCQK